MLHLRFSIPWTCHRRHLLKIISPFNRCSTAVRGNLWILISWGGAVLSPGEARFICMWMRLSKGFGAVREAWADNENKFTTLEGLVHNQSFCSSWCFRLKRFFFASLLLLPRFDAAANCISSSPFSLEFPKKCKSCEFLDHLAFHIGRWKHFEIDWEKPLTESETESLSLPFVGRKTRSSWCGKIHGATTGR